MTWWMWMLGGLLFLAAEILTPGGFFTLFFGCGALAVGLLSAMGVDLPLAGEVLLFLTISIASLALFRKPLMEKFQRTSAGKDVDSMVGEFAVAMEDIPANGIGKAELRGSSWSARNEGAATIARSARVRVERVDGLTLVLRG